MIDRNFSQNSHELLFTHRRIYINLSSIILSSVLGVLTLYKADSGSPRPARGWCLLLWLWSDTDWLRRPGERGAASHTLLHPPPLIAESLETIHIKLLYLIASNRMIL